MLTLTFYDWLISQSHRHDDTGKFARFARKDPLFPRRAKRLYLFLLRCEGLPEQRARAKRAHAEYRDARRAAKVCA